MEPTADENHFSGPPKKHPKEQQVDDAFMAKEYVQDKSGRFKINNPRAGKEQVQMQPTMSPLPELRPLEPLDPFKNMRRSMDPGGSLAGTKPGEERVSSSGGSKMDAPTP